MLLIDFLILHKGQIVPGALAAFLLAGQLLPFAPASWARAQWQRWGKNLGLAALNAGLSVLVVLPITVWAASAAPAWRPAVWQGLGGLALDIVLLDLWLYAWHRANHVLPVLWRFHQVHHLDQHMDASTALRFHFGEVLLSSLLRAGVVVLLAVPLASVLVFELTVAVVALFHHSNLRLPARLHQVLSWLIVTPSIHWVHHHAVRADTDSSYATLLSLWDHLFGSASPTVQTPGMHVGVEGAADESWMRLVLRPLR